MKATFSRTDKRKAVKARVCKTGMPRHATYHTSRYSFATSLLDRGYDIQRIQELLGHKDVGTTMIYTHVLKKGGPRCPESRR
jgi:site-specific recombinase XerD